jgi:hypothetical protein
VPRQLSPCSAPRSGSRRQVSWAPRTTVSQPDCSALALCSRASRPAACFIHPRPGWPGNVARVVFTVVVQGALNVMLEPLGIPTLTACVRAGDVALPAAESGASSALCLAVCRGMLAHVRRPDPSRESSAGWSGIHCDSPYPTSASQPGGSVSGLRAPHPRWSYEPAARLILPGAACR